MRKWISFLLTGVMVLTMCFTVQADTPVDKVSYYLDAEGKVNLYVSLGKDVYGEVMLTVF